MKAKFLILATALTISAAAAHADFLDTKVQDLFAQGFTHFEVARGTVKSQIEAYAPDGTKMTIVMDNQSGSSLSEQTLTGTSSDFSSIASSIAAVYSEQSNDNNESYSGGSNDGGNDSHSSGNDNDSNESYSSGNDNDSNDNHSGGSDNDSNNNHSSGNDNDSNDNDSDGHDNDSNDSDGHDDGGDDND